MVTFGLLSEDLGPVLSDLLSSSLSPEEQGFFCPVLALIQNDSCKAENVPCWGTRSFSHPFATICPFNYHALLKATISADSSSSLLVCVCVCALYI